MHSALALPFDSEYIMKKKKSIKRELLKQDTTMELRIAILGGSTTSEIKSVLELFLLDKKIKPSFYESEYNKWYEDSIFPNSELDEFKPQIIWIHTSFVNILNLPSITDGETEVNSLLETTLNKWKTVWESLRSKYGCSIIQNNFEAPYTREYGNLDFAKINGFNNFVNELNAKLSEYARANENFFINDINYLAASLGLTKWHDRNFYHLYKFAMGYDCIPALAYNIASVIGAIIGKSKKCLVLDLDNTLWGGVIGDDGVTGIQLGHETAVGEAFYDFQKYVLSLKERGVILAVCSKNEDDIAKSGFKHPDSLLKEDDFVVFMANWNPKHINIVEIAKQINIGMDSLVFLDDNPAERLIVRDNLPELTVPEVEGGNPMSYIQALEDGKYFEPATVSKDDLKRNQTYFENKKRAELEQSFTSYSDYLKSLTMTAEIKSFVPVYMERITQLTNKTNQFNLTTKRYTGAEIENVAHSDDYITLYGRLMDKFGDNGLVSVVIGRIEANVMHMDLWLMSCRVLKRDFEFAMFRELLKQAKAKGIKEICGYYYKTPKNAMVENFYGELGFDVVSKSDAASEWVYNTDKAFTKELFIDVN